MRRLSVGSCVRGGGGVVIKQILIVAVATNNNMLFFLVGLFYSSCVIGFERVRYLTGYFRALQLLLSLRESITLE